MRRILSAADLQVGKRYVLLKDEKFKYRWSRGEVFTVVEKTKKGTGISYINQSDELVNDFIQNTCSIEVKNICINVFTGDSRTDDDLLHIRKCREPTIRLEGWTNNG